MQLAARRDEIREIADGANIGVARQGLDMLGIEAHRATLGAAAIFERHRARLRAVVGPAGLDAFEILRVHTLRPLVRALIGAQSENAAIRGVAIVDSAGGIDVMRATGARSSTS